MSARLVGIGVGPGDPGLLTLRAVARLREAEVVAYPTLDDRPALTRKIVAPHLPPGRRELALAVPLARDASDAAAQAARAAAYDRAAEAIGAELAAGRTTALLCEGDPLFYGSFIHLHERLSERWPVEIVPGVSSLGAAAARLGAPLAVGDGRLVVLPGTMPPGEMRARLAQGGSFAILKPNRHWRALRESLEALGLDRRARMVSHATMEGEEVLAPGAPLPDSAPYFSILLVPEAPGGDGSAP